MNKKEPKSNSLEIMNRINEFTKDADWTVEELREELLNEGINPDKLVENVRKNILPFLSKNQEETKDKEPKRNFGLISKISENLIRNEQVEDSGEAFPTLLSLLRKFTGDMASKIAQQLEVNVPFLKGCSDYSEQVPPQCKKELIRRVGNVYPFVDKNKVEQVVENPKPLKKAALRSEEYSGSQMSFEEIVEKSDLDSETQKFWLELARENKDEISK